MRLGQRTSEDDIFFSLAKPEDCANKSGAIKEQERLACDATKGQEGAKSGYDPTTCECICANPLTEALDLDGKKTSKCCPPGVIWNGTRCDNPIVAAGLFDPQLAPARRNTRPLDENEVGQAFMAMSEFKAMASYDWAFCIYQNLYDQYQFYFSIFLGGPFESVQGCTGFIENLPLDFQTSSSSGDNSSSSSSQDLYYCVVENYKGSSGSEGVGDSESCNYSTSDCQSMFGPDYIFYPTYTSKINGQVYYCRCVATYYGTSFMDFKELSFVPGQQPLCVSLDEMRSKYQDYVIIEGPYRAEECNTNCGQSGDGGGGGGSSTSGDGGGDGGSSTSGDGSSTSMPSSSSSTVYYCAVNKMQTSSASSLPPSAGGDGDCDSRCKAYFGPNYCGGDIFENNSCECLPCVPAGLIPDIFANAFSPQQPLFCISSKEINESVHEIVGGPYASAIECNTSCGAGSSSTSQQPSSTSQQPSSTSGDGGGDGGGDGSSTSQQPSSSTADQTSSSSGGERCPPIYPPYCECGYKVVTDSDGCPIVECAECNSSSSSILQRFSSSSSDTPCPQIVPPRCECGYEVDIDESGCPNLSCAPCPEEGSSSSSDDGYVTCPTCDGSGISNGGTCPTCGGTGRVPRSSSSSEHSESSSSVHGQSSSASSGGEASSSGSSTDQSSSSSVLCPSKPTPICNCGYRVEYQEGCPVLVCESCGDSSSSSSISADSWGCPAYDTPECECGHDVAYRPATPPATGVCPYLVCHPCEKGPIDLSSSSSSSIADAGPEPTSGSSSSSSVGIPSSSSEGSSSSFISGGEATSSSSQCDKVCSAIGEVVDGNCDCVCSCPVGIQNTGVVFAPTGELICECLKPDLWLRVANKTLSSSSSSVEGSMASVGIPYCVALSVFDEDYHQIILPFVFGSEMDCNDYGEISSSSSSSSHDEMGFLTQPQNRSIMVGQGLTDMFSVTAFGSVSTYRWQHSVNGGATFTDINVNGGVFSGADTPTLGINAGMADTSSVFNGAKFRCVISNYTETKYSDIVTLTVGT